MADGKTVEEVARHLVDRWRFDTLSEPNDATLQDAIAIALRQREQETAAECARLVRQEGNQWTGPTIKFALEGAATLILSRFPKDQG